MKQGPFCSSRSWMSSVPALLLTFRRSKAAEPTYHGVRDVGESSTATLLYPVLVRMCWKDGKGIKRGRGRRE